MMLIVLVVVDNDVDCTGWWWIMMLIVLVVVDNDVDCTGGGG